MTFQIDEPLALNAIGSVVIHGLVKTRDGEEVDVQAVRSKPPPLVAVHEAHLWVRPEVSLRGYLTIFRSPGTFASSFQLARTSPLVVVGGSSVLPQ
ncbi:hypothetical protein A0H81_02070 [Grifola frondosa]|uniref:Uncharacterized protein n=1 Tax=Grifola frondosa TaxID=5627 RepID=A0A1C7MSN5_GRIFR|nr:hypothetical protein A0H81_02070 [Grifola frondosa]